MKLWNVIFNTPVRQGIKTNKFTKCRKEIKNESIINKINDSDEYEEYIDPKCGCKKLRKKKQNKKKIKNE